MSVTCKLPRSHPLIPRGPRWHRTVIASAALAAAALLSVGCGGHSVFVKHIQHAPGHSASQQAQTHTT
jgi:hypothetical protein